VRRVGMEEIEKNDFNLNISRYVSTAEAEEEVDLAKVHAELVALDKDIKTATQQHNEFLKELGLALLP
jgi:type I restriction enzyme M protein